jgi:hypothetical protein
LPEAYPNFSAKVCISDFIPKEFELDELEEFPVYSGGVTVNSGTRLEISV